MDSYSMPYIPASICSGYVNNDIARYNLYLLQVYNLLNRIRNELYNRLL